MPQGAGQSQQSLLNPQGDKDKDNDSEPRQLTMIFRPDEAGDWKERVRLSHEASERARLSGEGQSGSNSPWGERRQDDEDIKEEEEEEEEESSVVGDADGGKLWRAKRTLRK
jgi:striatin 1/3/4